MDGNGIIATGISWFHNGTLKTTTLYINDTNLSPDAPSILVIDWPFTSSNSGTYTCLWIITQCQAMISYECSVI